MKKTRILALILTCAMFVTLAGCGTTSYGTINGKDIDSALFDSAAKSAMSQYLSNGYDEASLRDMLSKEDENGQTGAEAIKEYCLESVKQMYAIEVMAEDHNIKLTDDDRNTIAEEKTSFIEQAGGRAAFVESLTSSGMTEEVFDRMQEISALQKKLSTAVFSKGGVHEVTTEEIVADMTTNCVRVVHILIQAQANSTDFAEKKAKAEATLARVNAGEDFNALIQEVGEDPGMTSNPDGYVFDNQGYTMDESGSQMVAEFTEASVALAVGQTSGLVQTDYGFHIIKRLPLDEAFIVERLDTYYPVYASMAFSMELAQVVAELKVETNDNYKNLDMASLIPKQTTTAQ